MMGWIGLDRFELMGPLNTRNRYLKTLGLYCGNNFVAKPVGWNN